MNTDLSQCGKFFTNDLIKEIRDKIAMVEYDDAGERIYFENAGGALTLKKVCEIACAANEVPDYPNRPTPGSKPLGKLISEGIADSKLIFGAKSGSILCDLTVSKSIFTMTGVIVKNVPGTNIVTTNLEHPATYDACKYYATMFEKELRVASIDKNTGSIDIK